MTLAAPGSLPLPSARAATPLAIGDTNGVTYLWDVASHRLLAPLRNPDGEAVFAAAFSPAGSTLAVGTENSKYDAGDIYLWDVPSRKVVRLTDPDGRGVDGVAFSPGGGILAAADNNAASTCGMREPSRSSPPCETAPPNP